MRSNSHNIVVVVAMSRCAATQQDERSPILGDAEIADASKNSIMLTSAQRKRRFRSFVLLSRY
jgi:hypothetical protein